MSVDSLRRQSPVPTQTPQIEVPRQPGPVAPAQVRQSPPPPNDRLEQGPAQSRPAERPNTTAQGLQVGARTDEAALKQGAVDGFVRELKDRAGDRDGFHAAMKDIYGGSYDAGRVEAFRQRALAGDRSWLPATVRFVDPATLGDGVGAAYSPRDGGTVLVSRSLAGPELQAAVAEEMGHHLDALLQLDGASFERSIAQRKPGERRADLADTRDAAGDEGARFAGFLRDGVVPASTGIEGKGVVDGVGEVEHHTVLADEVRTVRFESPSNLDMHASWKDTSLAPAFQGGKLDLNAVTPEMLKGLGPDNLKTFFGILEGMDARASVVTGGGRTQKGSSNAATLMAAKVWGSGDSETFAKVFAASPERIIPYLTGNGSRVLTAENLALIMKEMRASGREYTPKELDALGSLVQKYLERNIGKDPEKAGAAMKTLLTEINRSGLEFNAENAGVVGGVVVSGMLKHFAAIKATDEQRARIIGNVANTVGALAGAFGPWGNAVDVAINALNTVYQEVDQPRDYAEHASRFQSALQLRWLQHPPAGWNTDDTQNAILWMDASIKANGHR